MGAGDEIGCEVVCVGVLVFAIGCASLRLWWRGIGRRDLPLVTRGALGNAVVGRGCDAGGVWLLLDFELDGLFQMAVHCVLRGFGFAQCGVVGVAV